MQEKVFDFCEKVLKITNPRDSIGIDRSHRMGGRVTNKNRPVVVKSSIEMGILAQAFHPIFPHFSKLGPLFKKP